MQVEGRNYVEIAVAYAKEALADATLARHSRWVRLAAIRFFKDLKRCRQPDAPFVFDFWHAMEPCEFIENLPHVEGEWSTPNIELHPAHIFFIVNLFGFRLANGTRRFTSALLLIGRKNAKTLLAAGILLYCLCCEPEPGAKVISAATTGDQAKIIFKAAKAMVEKTVNLREAFGLEPFSKSIARPEEGSVFVPINAKASTQDGLNPSHVGLDEIHAHKDHDLLNVLRSAAGARKNTLWLYTTTEGYETPGPWPELRKNAQNILLGVYDDDKFLALMFCLDDDIGRKGDADYRPQDDEFDESKWVKANPLMEVNPELETAIRNHAKDAKNMPGQMAEFRIKRLNRQSAAADAWLRIPEWKRCGGAVDRDWLIEVGAPCWAGLDGASTTDIMAWRLVWRWEGICYTWGRRWVPQDAVNQRTERRTAPYAAWVEMGLIRMTPGIIIDYSIVEEEIMTDIERFHPEVIGYDSWNLRELAGRLKKKVPQRTVISKTGKATKEDRLVEVRQGGKTFNPAMKELERMYLSGNFRHGDDPVLNWCAANLVPRFDENLNQSPDRAKSADKIDDMAALLDAFAVMGAPVEEEKKPQLMFV